MSKVSLPFWRNAEPFEPKLYPEDLASFDDLEDAAKADKRPRDAVLRVHRDFVSKILSQTFPGEKVDLKLTVAEIRHATQEIYVKGQDWREAERPLGQGGASQAPSSSPV